MQCGPAIPLAGFHRSNNPSLQLRVAPDKLHHGDRRREMGGAEQCVESELPVRHESELGQWRRKLGSRHWLPGEPVLQRERKPGSRSEQPRVQCAGRLRQRFHQRVQLSQPQHHRGPVWTKRCQYLCAAIHARARRAAANAGLRRWLTGRHKSGRWAVRPQRCRWSTWTNMKPFGTWVKRPGGRKTLLNDAYFLDLDRDGILEIVNPPEFESYRPDDEEKPEQPKKYAVYKIAGEDGYKPSGLVFEFFSEFLAGPAKLQGDGFVASQPGAPYVMTIVTGDGRNVLPVTSAEVPLNGELVAGPEKINQNNRLLKVPVIVRAENVVEVTFSGPEGSALFIGVAPVRSESANRSSRPPLPGTRCWAGHAHATN